MTSSATRLHQILTDVAGLGSTLQKGWTGALDATWSSEEFAVRFAEVLALYTDTVTAIEGLPDLQREMYRVWSREWLEGLMGFQHNWSQVPVEHALTEDLRAKLASCGHLLDQTLRLTMLAPAATDLSVLAIAVRSLLDQVDSTTLPDNYANALRTQIRHVLWLIDQADRFGVSRAVQEAVKLDALANDLERVLPEERKRDWRATVASLGLAVAFVNGATTTYVIPALETTKKVVQQIENLKNEVTSDAPDDQVLEGEVVSDSGDQAPTREDN